MSELLFILAFILWYGLALIISEKYGKNSYPGVEWLFFIAMLFSPLIGFIVTKLLQHK